MKTAQCDHGFQFCPLVIWRKEGLAGKFRERTSWGALVAKITFLRRNYL